MLRMVCAKVLLVGLVLGGLLGGVSEKAEGAFIWDMKSFMVQQVYGDADDQAKVSAVFYYDENGDLDDVVLKCGVWDSSTRYGSPLDFVTSSANAIIQGALTLNLAALDDCENDNYIFFWVEVDGVDTGSEKGPYKIDFRYEDQHDPENYDLIFTHAYCDRRFPSPLYNYIDDISVIFKWNSPRLCTSCRTPFVRGISLDNYDSNSYWEHRKQLVPSIHAWEAAFGWSNSKASELIDGNPLDLVNECWNTNPNDNPGGFYNPTDWSIRARAVGGQYHEYDLRSSVPYKILHKISY